MFANTRRIEKPPKYLQSCSYYVHCGSWWEMNLQKNAGGQNTFFKLAQVLKKQTSEPRWTKNRRPTWRTFLTYCLETLSLSLSPTLDKIHYIFGTCADSSDFQEVLRRCAWQAADTWQRWEYLRVYPALPSLNVCILSLRALHVSLKVFE